MELTHLKKFKNGKLPCFDGGTPPRSPSSSISLFFNNSVPRTINNVIPGIYNLASGTVNPISYSAPYKVNIPQPSRVQYKQQQTTRPTNNAIPKQNTNGNNGTGSVGGQQTSSTSPVGSLGTWGDVILNGINAFGSTINSFTDDETLSGLLAKYGTSQGNVDGIGYIMPNMVDGGKENNEAKKIALGKGIMTTGSLAALGGSIGTVIEPGGGTLAGTAIGAGVGAFLGLGGGAEEVRQRQLKVERINNWVTDAAGYARAGADTQNLRLKNANEYGNPDDQYLYEYAENGREPKINKKTGYTKNKYPSWTSEGLKLTNANSKLAPREIVFDTKTGSTTRVAPWLGKHWGDIAYGRLKERDAVITDEHQDPATGVSFADSVALGLDNPYNVLYRQAMYVNNKNSRHAKNGRIPGYDGGKPDGGKPDDVLRFINPVPNMITSGLGILGGIYQGIDAISQDEKYPSTFVENPYEISALDTLAKLKVNPYPTSQQLKQTELKTNRAGDMSGGLGVGQRRLYRLAAQHQTLRNWADALANYQLLSNALQSNLAKTLLETGANKSKLKMADNQYALDFFSKAHAARQSGKWTGFLYNPLKMLQQYYSNSSLADMFNRTMDLYNKQLSVDEKKALADIENMAFNRQNAQNKSAVNPFLYLPYGPQFYAAAMMKNLDLAKRRG